MSQFRSLSSVKKTQSRVLMEEQSVSITPSITSSLPLFSTQTTPSTGNLSTISDSIPVAPVIAGQFQVLPGGLPVTSTTGRILRIPGARKKRTPTTDALPVTRHRMSSRLRHGIILFAIFFIGIFTLLSLAPLDNGQSALPIVNGITNWVRAEQSSWQFQAHLAPVSPPSTSSSSTNDAQSVAAPPPMSLPKSVYIAIAQQDAIDAGISPDYFVRQINQESGFNPNAVSPAGAVGIAQFLPSTAAGLSINPWDPKQALYGAAHVMADYARNYGGDYAKALAAYNGGSGTVQYAVNACGATNWMNCLPGETRNYIYVIMGI